MIPALRVPWLRLARSPRGWAPIVGWTLLVVAAAVTARGQATRAAVDDAVLGPFAGIALPLLVFGLVSAVLGGDALARAARPLVAFGDDPARVALGASAVAIGASALVGLVLGALVPAVAHAPADAQVARDVLTTAWISALGGAAYAAFFVLGSAFGPRGMGRSVALAVDWILGAGSGAGAFVTPRAHLRSLLGGASVLSLSERASAAALLVLGAAYVAITAARARRT